MSTQNTADTLDSPAAPAPSTAAATSCAAPSTSRSATRSTRGWCRPTRPTPRSPCGSGRTLHDTYIELGHEVELIDPVDGLPDMVYTANGGFLIDGIAYGPKFRFQERAGEEGPFIEWFRANGFDTRVPVEVNEGEGDFLLVGDTILAGTGLPLHRRQPPRDRRGLRPRGRHASP